MGSQRVGHDVATEQQQIYVYNWIAFPSSSNSHNIVSQLYFNFKNLLTFLEIMKNLKLFINSFPAIFTQFPTIGFNDHFIQQFTQRPPPFTEQHRHCHPNWLTFGWWHTQLAPVSSKTFLRARPSKARDNGKRVRKQLIVPQMQVLWRHQVQRGPINCLF